MYKYTSKTKEKLRVHRGLRGVCDGARGNVIYIETKSNVPISPNLTTCTVTLSCISAVTWD